MKSLCFSPHKLPSHPHSRHPSPSRPSFSDSIMDHALEQAEPTITKWSLEATSSLARAPSLFYENRHEAIYFVKTVHALQRAMHLCVAENCCSSEKLIRAQDLMQIAMKRLQKEFYQILSTERAHLDPESVSSSRTSRTSTASSSDDDDVSGGDISEVEDVLVGLRLIAECMISSGYGKECVNIYKIIRKSVVDGGVYRLGVERFGSPSQARKMGWEAVEVRIRNWLGALRTAVSGLFSGERYLCDRVFASSDAIRESCFADVTREGADVLFGFPEDVVNNDKKRSPEKIFRALDMYGAIADHWPEIDSIFSFESTSGSKRQALASLDKLGEYARSALTDYESAILKDSSRTPVAGAGIHHLTIDAMHYLCNLSDYSAVLSDILADPPPPAKKGLSPEPYSSDPGEFRAPAISGKLAWLILVLLCKLDSKAKQYKDVALSYLFLANNLRYVVARVRGSDLKYLLGDEWVKEHESKVKLFASSYERLGWCHVIESLPSDPCTVRNPREAREVFQRFNLAFDRAYEKNAACVVPDDSLRDNIKASLVKKVVMLYRGFYEQQHRVAMEKERHLASVVRYTPDDVAQRLSDLFCRDVGQR